MSARLLRQFADLLPERMPVLLAQRRQFPVIGKSAMEAIARQPEAAGNVRSSMIIAGALVEGATLFAVVVCILAVVK